MSLLITGVIDGPLSGGIPKAIELTATADIADLSLFGVGSANNGGGTDGEEFTLSGSASAGDKIYVASEATGFTTFFGFAPTFTSGAMAINGDDAIELFENGSVIDTFGEIDVDGSGDPWEYLDGWAYRTGVTPGGAFTLADWSFSGPNALDGESDNASAATPFPIGTFGAAPVAPGYVAPREAVAATLLSDEDFGGAEILAFDPSTDRGFLVDGSATVQIIDMSDPTAPVALGTLTPPAGTDGANSVAVAAGLVAVAYQATEVSDPGTVAFYDAATGALRDTATVGALPDMLTFADDLTVVVANEGEEGNIDPEGSVSIIRLTAGADLDTVVDTADFSGFSRLELETAGVRLFPEAEPAQDLEPEYITVVGGTAYVALQEANALAVVDIATATVTEIRGLGTVDHSQIGNELDTTDRDDVPNLVTAPIQGLRMPDAITSFTIAGTTYIATANEGDARNEDERIEDLTLDPTAFPDAADLQDESALGRLQASTIDGDTDGDGDFDALFSYGGRGFTIFDTDGAIVFESGGLISRIMAAELSESDYQELDGRSDNKGAEPEGVTFGEVDGVPYLFVGLERAKSVLMFDVTDPANPVYERRLVSGGEEPEGLTFVSAADSPTGQALLVVMNEDSETVDIWGLGATPASLKKISEVQGAGAVSPLDGEEVIIEGVVVGDYDDDGELRGFYVQEERGDEDGDAATSEGVFVFVGDTDRELTNVSEGDLVRVAGTVDEFADETQIDQVTSLTVLDSGQLGTVDAAVVKLGQGGARIDDAAGYEATEGMLVTIPDTLVVSEYFELARFGQIVLTEGARPYQFTQQNTPDVAGYEAHLAELAQSQIILDDGSSSQNPYTGDTGVYPYPDGGLSVDNFFRGGDSITGLTGVMDFSFGEWRLQPTEAAPVTFESTNPRPETPEDVGGTLQVASFNVLNYFTTIDDGTNDARGAHSEAELDRQTDKLVTALLGLDADILGLVEIENEFEDLNGDGRFAVKYLIDALNDAEGTVVWDYVDPGRAMVDTSDVISTAMIYRTDTVAVSAGTSAAILDDAAVDLIPGADPGHALFDGQGSNRASLAATFTEIATGEQITIATNHFKSKGSVSPFGDNAGTGDGTANNNEARTQAANALDLWLETNPTGAATDRFLILGDLNAYAEEDPINLLESEGYTDLAQLYGGPDSYGYLFDSQLGTLDYAMSSTWLTPLVTGATEWHINADEIPLLDYNDDILDPGERSFEEEGGGADLYAVDPYRTSDHDPVVIGLQLAANLVTDGKRGWSKGSDEIDRFVSGAGRNDRMISARDEVPDTFVFGAETFNGKRDRDIIRKFEIDYDLLELVDGAEIASIRESRSTLQVRFEGDGDLLIIRGRGLDADALTVLINTPTEDVA